MKASSPLIVSLLFGLCFCTLAWALGLLNWRTAAKLAGWWLLMGSASITVLSVFKQYKRIPWVLFGLVCLFAVDIGVQGVIRHFFGSAPTPSLLVEALANTNSSESIEFIREHGRSILNSVVFAFVMLLVAWYVLLSLNYQASSYSKKATLLSILLLILVGLNPTMLRQNPLTRWPVLFSRHLDAQKAIKDMDRRLQLVDSQHLQWRIQTIDPDPKTVIVVIGESGNRDNWGLYGYFRDTTRPLANALNDLSGQNILFRDVWSNDAFTQPALSKALTPATKQQPDIWLDTPGITQMAREAGYQTMWLSNQTTHEGWFDALARRTDFKIFINHGNWRDSSSTDEQLLPILKEQLSTHQSSKELIVIHLLGQHFYYNQRCPVNIHPFSQSDDEVQRVLNEQGRSSATITARGEYDNAIYCGANVLAEILKTAQAARADRALSVLYFSDHGQEVGHHENFAGHTQRYLSGFSIPMLLWVNSNWKESYPVEYANRPFRNDWVDQTVQHLLGIRSAWYDQRYDVLSPNYAPNESVLPALTDDK